MGNSESGISAVGGDPISGFRNKDLRTKGEASTSFHPALSQGWWTSPWGPAEIQLGSLKKFLCPCLRKGVSMAENGVFEGFRRGFQSDVYL